MSNETTSAPVADKTGLDGMDARRDINRIAAAVVERRIATEEQLASECLDVAHEHYVEIKEVYKKVWARVDQSPELKGNHPAGKTRAYHALRLRAAGD